VGPTARLDTEEKRKVSCPLLGPNRFLLYIHSYVRIRDSSVYPLGYPITGMERPLWLQEVEAPRISIQSANEDGKVVSPTHRSDLSTDRKTKESWFDCRQGQAMCLFSYKRRQALDPTDPPIQGVPRVRSTGVKQSRHEAVPPLHPYAFIACTGRTLPFPSYVSQSMSET
jgi:hypothetical protein